MAELIVVPGFGGSGPAHWQSRWEKNDPSIRRFQPQSWDEPELRNWIEALELAVSESVEPPVLIAHSLGCLLVAQWQTVSSLSVAGAFLVAVPDPSTPGFSETTPGFSHVASDPLRFPSLIVASTNDPYDAHRFAVEKAHQWRSEFCSLGDLGHINGQSGLGDWPFGKQLLDAFIARIGKEH
ncbi:RBBP9/YdeN family alpha/beta hydrolase [Pseudomonas sp. NA-150]|uniref:RBBP9/YdeN family alpha/beta hydrolase n=1 Tax=Pseudomonas sp. NA-150 TaxID=3367525 RepID=UPI0037C92B38